MTNLQNDPPNVTRVQFAKQLQVALPTLDRWVRIGYAPKPIKFGTSRNAPIRWRQSVVDSFVAGQEGQEAQS